MSRLNDVILLKHTQSQPHILIYDTYNDIDCVVFPKYQEWDARQITLGIYDKNDDGRFEYKDLEVNHSCGWRPHNCSLLLRNGRSVFLWLTSETKNKSRLLEIDMETIKVQNSADINPKPLTGRFDPVQFDFVFDCAEKGSRRFIWSNFVETNHCKTKYNYVTDAGRVESSEEFLAVHDQSTDSLVILRKSTQENVFKIFNILKEDNFLFDKNGKLFICHMKENGDDPTPIITVLDCSERKILKAKYQTKTLVSGATSFSLIRDYVKPGFFVMECVNADRYKVQDEHFCWCVYSSELLLERMFDRHLPYETTCTLMTKANKKTPQSPQQMGCPTYIIQRASQVKLASR